MQPNIKKIATYVALTATLGHLASAQLTWDPDANQINDGGAGTWDTAALNWDDDLSAPNVAWTNGLNATFGTGTYQVDLDSAGVTVGDLTFGGGVLTFKGSSLTGSPGDAITVSPGATWDTGGGSISFFNNGNNNNTRLVMASGTLTVTGGGTLAASDNPQNNANGTWDVGAATLDVTTAATVRGDSITFGAFDTIKLIDGSRYVHDRNSDRTYATNWELGAGTVRFDNKHGRNMNMSGLFSGDGRLRVEFLGGRQFVLQNAGNTFGGGLEFENARVQANSDGALGTVPVAFVADNISITNSQLRLAQNITLDANRGITINSGASIEATGTGAITIGGAITGSGGLTFGRAGQPTGTYGLSGVSDYTGGTTIYEGNVRIESDEALGAGPLTIGGEATSRLILNGNSQTIGGLTTAANNTRQVVNLNSSAAVSGTAGTLIIDVADTESYTYGSAYGNNSTQNFGNFNTVKNGLGTQQFNNMQIAGDLTVNDGLLVINDANANAAGATSVTGGTLRINNVLTSASYATSGTGILQIGNAGTTGNIGGADVANDGTVLFNRSDALSYTGVISGTGGLQVDGGATITLTGVNTFTGPVEVLDGTLIVGSAAALVDYSVISVAAEEIFLISYEGTDWTSAEVAGSGGLSTTINWLDPSAYLGLDISAGSIALDDAASGAHGLWVQGNSADVLTINTPQTYTGNTYLQHGEILLTANDQLPATTALTLDASGSNASRLQLNGSNQTIGGLTALDTGTKELVNNSATTSTLTFDVAADDDYSYTGNFVAPLAGTFNLVKNGGGTQSLDRNGLSGYTGTATVNAGRLGFRFPSSIDPTTQTITVSAGAAFLLEAGNASEWLMANIDTLFANATFNAGSSLAVKNQTEAFDYTSDITGDIGLIKTGNATLTLSGTNTYTGKTIVEGSLIVIDDEADLGTTPVVLAADHLTLDGGGIQAAAALIIDDANRGITLLDGGGTLNNNELTMTVASPIVGTGSLNVTSASGQTAGYVELTGTNTYSGDTIITQTSLKVSSTASLPDTSNLTINGVGILLLEGDLDGGNAADFTRSLGTAAGELQFTNGGGFAASGADRSFDIGGAGADLEWGVGGFMPDTVPSGFTFFLSAPDATHTTTLVNGLILPGAPNYGIFTTDSVADLDGVIEGVISGTGGLRIRSNGTLSLKGDNSYEGATNIEDSGTLLVNGDQSAATGNVTVSASATLGGTGTIGGAVTVQLGGTITAGASAGTLTVASLTHNDGANMLVEIDNWNAGAVVAGTDSDLVVVTGALTGHTTISGSTITIPATPGDFTEVGASFEILTFGAAVDITADIFAVNDTAWTGTGTWAVSVDADSVNLEYTVAIVSAYGTWATDNGLDGSPGNSDSPDDDPEFDGIANVLEYILGGDPLAADLSILPDGVINGANYELTFTRSDDSETDAEMSVEFSSDLTDFSILTAVVPATSGLVGSVTFTIIENGVGDDDVTASIPHGGATEFFGRAVGEMLP